MHKTISKQTDPYYPQVNIQSQGGSDILSVHTIDSFSSIVTPLPRIEGVQVTSSSVSSTSSGTAAISTADLNKYKAIYKNQNPSPKGISAEAAKSLFAKSRLPNEQLGQIW